MTTRPLLPLAALLVACSLPLVGDPLSKHAEVDFFRDTASRDLHGLAARSDGRLIAGPTYRDLDGKPPADILWCIASSGPGKWLVGTGPTGAIVEVTLDTKSASYTSRPVASVDDSHVFSLLSLPDGSILAGTSPHGGLYLVQRGKVTSKVALPADSVLDIVADKDGVPLVATGNPGKIYALDLAKFAKAGVDAARVTDPKALAQKGLTVFGEIRDKNVRRLACLPDGTVIAGSAPKGNVYRFQRGGGAPYVLQENRDAEVTDLVADSSGGFYASIVFSGGLGESRLNLPAKDPKSSPGDSTPPPAQVERFAGRASIVWFPEGGFPETLSSRPATAFYRLARFGSILLAAGGEQGEIDGVEIASRKAITFSGSASSQLNALAAVDAAKGQFVVLRNNAPGLGLIDFSAAGPRSVVTRRIDLGSPARLGAVRFERLHGVGQSRLDVSLATSNASEDSEGWSGWTELSEKDGAWKADSVRGRYVRLKLLVSAGADPAAEIEKADLYYLPQDHRPVLQDFHLLSPNYGLIPAAEPVPSATVTLNQLIQASDHDSDRKHSAFLSSQVVASPGTQVITWTVNDSDGDTLAYTFSVRRDGDKAWTDLALHTKDNYVQFDTSHMPEGVYFTRLVAEETSPRPAKERLSVEFDTDEMVIDHTPPDILEVNAEKVGEVLQISVHGKDALSLLDSLEVTLNNGVQEQTEQPADGIRDSREETFVIEIPLSRASGATSAEVTLYDAAGNAATRRISW